MAFVVRLTVAILICTLASCTGEPSAAPQYGALGLQNRKAGAPEHCIPIQPGDALRLSEGDRHTLLYGSGRTIWVNHLQKGCSFHYGDPLVSQPIGSSYCRGDLVSSFDTVTKIRGPGCLLGEFVPYTY
jgi:hypothetical protein